MKVLVIDNYDSFVYNLVCMMHNLVDATIDVVKNDKVNFETFHLYDKIVLSPGPGIPINAGKMMEVLEKNKSLTFKLSNCLNVETCQVQRLNSLSSKSLKIKGLEL